MSISWRLSKDTSKDQTQSHHWGLRYLRVDVKPELYDKNEAYKAGSRKSWDAPEGLEDYIKSKSEWKRGKGRKEKLLLKLIIRHEPSLIPSLELTDRYGMRKRHSDIYHYRSTAQRLLNKHLKESEATYNDKLEKEFIKTLPPKPKVMVYIEPSDYTYRLQRLMAVRYKKNIQLATWSKLNPFEYRKARGNQDFDLCEQYDYYWQIVLLWKAIKWELTHKQTTPRGKQ